MADIVAIQGIPPNTKEIQYLVEVSKQSDYLIRNLPEYRFSDGKVFLDGDNRGVYNVATN